jgi:hypothetical protein
LFRAFGNAGQSEMSFSELQIKNLKKKLEITNQAKQPWYSGIEHKDSAKMYIKNLVNNTANAKIWENNFFIRTYCFSYYTKERHKQV